MRIEWFESLPLLHFHFHMGIRYSIRGSMDNSLRIQHILYYIQQYKPYQFHIQEDIWNCLRHSLFDRPRPLNRMFSRGQNQFQFSYFDLQFISLHCSFNVRVDKAAEPPLNKISFFIVSTKWDLNFSYGPLYMPRPRIRIHQLRMGLSIWSFAPKFVCLTSIFQQQCLYWNQNRSQYRCQYQWNFVD